VQPTDQCVRSVFVLDTEAARRDSRAASIQHQGLLERREEIDDEVSSRSSGHHS
jgi:hypothetical protein